MVATEVARTEPLTSPAQRWTRMLDSSDRVAVIAGWADERAEVSRD